MGYGRKQQSTARARCVEKKVPFGLSRERRANIPTTYLSPKRHRRHTRGVASASKLKSPSTGHPSSNTIESSALRRAFEGTVDAYRERAAAEKVTALQPAYENLLARVEGKGGDATAPAHPGGSELEALVHGLTELCEPLDAETSTIKVVRKNGIVEEQDQKLCDTLQAFRELVNSSRARFDEILERLRQVDQEIETLKTNVRKTEETTIAEAKREWEAALESHAREAQRAKELTMVAVGEALKMDKAATEREKNAIPRMLNELENKMRDDF